MGMGTKYGMLNETQQGKQPCSHVVPSLHGLPGLFLVRPFLFLSSLHDVDMTEALRAIKQASMAIDHHNILQKGRIPWTRGHAGDIPSLLSCYLSSLRNYRA